MKTDSLKGEKHLLKLDNIINGKDTRTTVMIRNIPIKYTDKMLIEELEEFKGKFDCIYMPYDYEKRGNKEEQEDNKIKINESKIINNNKNNTSFKESKKIKFIL